jgi:hypothetical protein
MDLIGALVHFTSFDAKFQFENEEETRKDCYYSWESSLQGMHNELVLLETKKKEKEISIRYKF